MASVRGDTDRSHTGGRGHPRHVASARRNAAGGAGAASGVAGWGAADLGAGLGTGVQAGVPLMGMPGMPGLAMGLEVML